MSGLPVIAHSRVRPEGLIANRAQGLQWLAGNYALPIDTVHTMLAFYEREMGRIAHTI